MTNLEKFAEQRDRLVAAAQAAGAQDVLYNAYNIPKSLPCAIVSLEEEDGLLPTGRRYMENKLSWEIKLIVNAHEVADPDSDLYAFKESFRAAHIAQHGKDFGKVVYYLAYVDGVREVRVAKLSGVLA